jgi:hypothetical protein
MEQEHKYESAENDMTKMVLEEISTEVHTLNQNISDVIVALNVLPEKIDRLKQELQQPVTVKTDLTRLEHIEDSLRVLHNTVAELNYHKKRPFQILLFPEQDRKLFYRIVFGRWLLYLLIMLVLNHTYKWAIHYTDKKTELQFETLKTDRIHKAWIELYNSRNKNLKKLMDKAIINRPRN